MIRVRITSLIASTPALLILLTSLVQAQTFRARVEGIVTDESKAVIADAMATLTNVNTSVKVIEKQVKRVFICLTTWTREPTP